MLTVTEYEGLLRWREITKKCVLLGCAKLDLWYKACEEVRAYEMRYNHNHDEKGRFCSGDGVDKGGNSGIIKVSGAVSGALVPESEEAQKHAEQYYEAVRHMTTDCKRIAENTGYTQEEIKSIKEFIFLEKHDLGNGKPEFFYPCYEMAQSWQRLIDGKNIQPHDITLIKHEIMESKLMKLGYSQRKAHNATSKLYDYKTECEEYYATVNKHK